MRCLGWGVAGAAVFLVGLSGCAQIIGANDYTTQTGSSTGTGCANGQKGCFCGTPMTREQFLNACTTADCVPFDATRVTKLAPGAMRPGLPAGTGGGTSSSSSSTSATTSTSVTTTASTGTGMTNACSGLPNPVYVTGSSAAKPFLAVIAQALAANGTMTLVYQAQGSCLGADAILNGTPMKGTASHWDPAQPNVDLAETPCTLDFGQAADVGVSDVFATTCFQLPQGLQGVNDSFGPVQAMAFVVPGGSTEKSISADAGYFVYGFGAASGVAPWTDETSILQRNADSGTQGIISAGIGVPPNRFKGQMNATSNAMLTALVGAANPAAAIGILAADVTDTNRTKLHELAFEDLGQTCAFYPDSTASSLDKANVRDGHYSLWGPLHFFTKNPNTTVQQAVNFLTGMSSIKGLDVIQVYVTAHVVPLCAMHVSRTTDGGAPVPFKPTVPCGCDFDAKTTGSTTCMACTSSSQCPSSAPNCSFGYCEQ